MIREKKNVKIVRYPIGLKKLAIESRSPAKNVLESCYYSFKYSKAELKGIIFDRVNDPFNMSDFHRKSFFSF